MTDNGAGTFKEWWFRTDAPPFAGLPSAYSEANQNAATLYKSFGWMQYQIGSTLGNVYESSVDTQLNPGASYMAESKTTQALDAYGNVTQVSNYDYGNLSNAARTYSYTYLTGANYAPLYIFNRLTAATLTTGGRTTTLVENQYDNQGPSYLPSNVSCSNLRYLPSPPYPSSLVLFDQTYASAVYLGNLTASHQLNSDQCIVYQLGGVAVGARDGSGLETDAASSSATNFSLPDSLTPSGTTGLGASMTYAGSFAVTSVTLGNGQTVQTTYDYYGRPATSTSADGAVTTYAYHYASSSDPNPYYPYGNTQMATVDSSNAYKITTLDGFGRTIRVETGTGSAPSGDISIVDTQYAPCACSPLGKVSAVSQPYAPGATPILTYYYLRRLRADDRRCGTGEPHRGRLDHIRLPGQQHHGNGPRRQ